MARMAGFFESTGRSLIDPIVSLWDGFVNLLPGLIIALIILIIGYVVAYVIGYGVKKLLIKIGLEKWVDKAKLTKAIGNIKLSSVFGEVIKWYIFVIFLGAAVDVLELGTLSTILKEFVGWVPHLIAGALIVIFGLFIAHYVANKIRQNAEMVGAKLLSNIIYAVIVVIVMLIALEQIGIN
ncbi:MAG: hypothetical protein QW404_03420, partial [Candidatus Nanoarchaeia archaeon]